MKTKDKETETKKEIIPAEKSIFETREENLELWIGYWRENIHRFAEEYLDIKLYPFQKILLYKMGTVNNFKYIAARSQGKSFLIAVYSIIRAILYPGTRIIVASSTKSQANLIITQKVQELYNRHSMVREEIGSPNNLKTSSTNPSVTFKNGSSIATSVSTETGRGARANVLIIDEYPLVEEKNVTEVLRPMAGSERHLEFKIRNPIKYADYEEPNVEMMLSSARYKNEWGWESFKETVERMLDNPINQRSFAVAIPYQVSVLHGLLSMQTINDAKNSNSYDPLGFSMEWEAHFVGEGSDAFFELAPINEMRVLDKAFKPPTNLEYYENSKLSQPKNLTNMPLQEGEIRLISLDVALMGGRRNDTSVFTLARMIPTGHGDYKQDIVYIESINESITDIDLAIRFKQLYYDFEATYAILDSHGNGLGVYDRCSEVLYDKERDTEYPAWESINDHSMRSRFTNPNAHRVLYTIKASAALNTQMALSLKSSISNGKVRFLVNDISKREDLVERHSFNKLTTEEQHRELKAYFQTSALVNELISLTYERAGANIRLREGSGGTKDRYSSLAYLHHIANEIEMEQKRKKVNDGSQFSIYINNWK